MDRLYSMENWNIFSIEEKERGILLLFIERGTQIPRFLLIGGSTFPIQNRGKASTILDF